MEKRRYRSLPWYEWYGLASQYYRKNHDLLIPSNYQTWDGYKLGRWIERQRLLYHKNSHLLTEKKRQLLENIEMVWCIENRYPWQEWIALCDQHIVEFGDLDIPKQYEYEGVQLGEWLFQQKKKKREGTLEEDKIDQLHALGVSFEINTRLSWMEWYSLIEKYYQDNGNINIKVHQIDEYENKIGMWLYMQREKYRHKRKPYLSNTQIEYLNSLQIHW